MPSEIKLPELGENLSGGDVLDIKVAPGDEVAQGQPLVEIEAEKSTVEVPSPVAGRVTKVLVKKGDSIQVGQAFCLIDGKDGEKNGAQKAPAKESPSAGTEPEPKAAVRQAEIAEPAEAAGGTTPAPPPPPGPRSNGQDKQVEQKVPTDSPRLAAPQREELSSTTPEEVVPAGPATRRLARELGIDINQVPGSAHGGRVTQEDVKAYVRGLASQNVPAGSAGVSPALAAGTAALPPLPEFQRWGPIERQPLSGIRRKTAEQMSLAWRVIPHVTQHDQADITDLESFRKEQESRGPKLTVTAFALKAAASALKQFPSFNASLDAASGQLILKKYIHIGVAVDTDRGLLVPVLRDADKKNVSELAQELAELADKARQKKISADEMQGGTFTITNLGGIGGTAFTPIVNYPEVAILGLSRSRLQPVIKDGQVVPRLILPLSLSYDHRVIDGAAAARFTRRIAEMLENPLLMLL
ncbi:MAG TPA: 2-oxo acid dehydrogenase subunit E2 [Gemmataceae bacterium]|jgi:pyruvate dehydrogenase E2 component (dihydrolipoamide acetyltransferase)|nr:2-oxo acid dehydrogenase subunit E2 [Gemmataceae bacterium]